MKQLLEDPRIPEEQKTRVRNFMDTVTPVEYRDITVDTLENFVKGYVKPGERQVRFFFFFLKKWQAKKKLKCL